MTNPLVAPVQDSTQWYTGMSLLESGHELKSAIESGEWASVALGTVGTALDALSVALDPFGAILANGVGWLMEHVGPLKEALDGLTGNADEVKAQAQTWKNVATELGAIGQDLAKMTEADTASWTGASADAYRKRVDDTVALLNSAQQGCEGASSGVQTAGEVVAAVRALVRDIIAELVGHMISWALQVLFTLGIGLTWVVPQVVNAVAKTAANIAQFTNRLIKAIKNLIPLLKRAGDLFSDAAKAFRNIKPGKVDPIKKNGDIGPPPKDTSVPKGGNGDTTPSGSGNGSTTPSGSPDGGGTPKGGPDPSPTPKGGPDSTPSPTPGGGSTTPSGSGPSGSGKTPDPSPNPNKPDNARDTGVGPDNRVCKSDPIDVASGEMILIQDDVSFPGALELVLQRTHVSSYRAGRLFGPSWASSVDQRLELDKEHACYFSPDGMILVYPLPSPGGRPQEPLEGPRWPLSIDASGAYVINDPARRRTLTFAAKPAADGTHPLTAIEGGGDSVIRIEHNADGVPVSWLHSDGYRVDLGIEDRRLRRLSVVDASGGMTVQVAAFGYDHLGRLTAVVNSSGKPMVFDYDDSGRVLGWQDRNGAWYRYVYDDQGRCVRTVGDKGYLDGTFEYKPGVTRYTDSLGHTTTFELNDLRQVVRETDPLGNVTEFVHDRYDKLLSRTDPLGRTTSFTYDAFGRLSGVVRPDGSVVSVNSDPAQPLIIEVAEGERTWSREYTGQPGAGVPDLTSEQIGVATGLPAGDADGEPESGEDESEYRDLFGRPRARTDVFGGQVRFEWTVEGLRAARIGRTGAREQWRYDAEGNEIEHKTVTGGTELAEYGPFGLCTATIDANGARTTYSYDTELKLTSVTNPAGLTWHYRYDPAGRLVEERDFDGRVLRFFYDAAGQLVRSVNGLGEAIDYTRDLLGNIVRRHTPAGITEYTYDPVGRLVRAANADAALEFDRDESGRVLRETTNGNSVVFSYDSAGNVVSRRTSSGVDSHWRVDGDGIPSTLTFAGHEMRFDHDRAGRELRRTIDDSLELTQSFDAELLTGQTLASPSGPLQQRRLDYRPDGSLNAVTDALSGVTRYGYDPAGRVVEVAAADHHESYRYDPAGHLVESTVAGQWPPEAENGTRTYVANTLSSAGVVGYTYDSQGRLIRRTLVDPAAGAQTWLYSWDPLDRMTGVTTPDGSRWRYLYDPLGRRIAKLRLRPDGTVAERVDFGWANTQLIEQVYTDAQGIRHVLTWERHPADDRPIAQAELIGGARRVNMVVTDQLGSPTELAAATTGLTWRRRATLWGKVTTPGGIPLRFPGQYADPETGLHYNVYRYYDPATGRYLSQDPLGLRPAPDPAAYVPNPLLQTDPLGLMYKAPCGAGGSGNRPPKRPGGDHDGGQLGQPAKKPRRSDVDPKSGRTQQQGGGKEGGGTYGKGNSTSNAAGNSPKPGHLTDVEDLNQAAITTNKQDPVTGEWYGENKLSQELADHLSDNNMAPDTKWIKGHLENDNLGGKGTSDNLTPLTDKANKAHHGGVEKAVKDFVDRVNGEAWQKSGLPDNVKIEYNVKVSDDVKFPNSPNPFERSIRDYIEINAEYKNVTPEVVDKLKANGMMPLADLPPKGTRMDTITGEFLAPDGKGGFVPWKKDPKGQQFSFA
ncbi:RHS repeat-associated core domain-containing protein [Kibdelosporangium persicum]|uniref:Type IV secretion protein Rhs n=1 Tax=Kibdelosporangium persicum TaxID=2698649 RepID=A0ABX2F3F0_9PSEU|nr:RHS repeat-associated core domain-containing protein [Kibdelosporangium persicum]NRN65832.1 Type IV secretion protein Rhs [Kibdelosporangium persicum]